MDAPQIREVLHEVFGRNLQIEPSGGWLKFRCPLAPWTHERGHDSNPSAGVSIHPNGTSVFRCFTCKNPAPLHGFLRRYAEFSGDDLDDLIEELEEQDYLGPRELPEWGAGRADLQPEMEPLDKAIFMDLYEPAAGHPYLRKRGISDETANKLQLMVDPSDSVDGEERILFPVFGLDGSLYGFSGRAIRKGAKLKVRDYMGLKKARCLLGAHLIATEKPDKVLVVEGLFDYANAWECGQPAVAVMHSSITEAQAEILRDICLPTYDFMDDDDAGRMGGAELARALARYQPVLRTRYPQVWIEDPSEPDGGHWLKDPGELTPEEFQEMIRDCRLY